MRKSSSTYKMRKIWIWRQTRRTRRRTWICRLGYISFDFVKSFLCLKTSNIYYAPLKVEEEVENEDNVEGQAVRQNIYVAEYHQQMLEREEEKKKKEKKSHEEEDEGVRKGWRICSLL